MAIGPPVSALPVIAHKANSEQSAVMSLLPRFMFSLPSETGPLLMAIRVVFLEPG